MDAENCPKGQPVTQPGEKVCRPNWLNTTDIKDRGWRREWIDPLLGPPVVAGGKWWRREEVERAERDGRIGRIIERFEQLQLNLRAAEKEAVQTALDQGLADNERAKQPLPKLTLEGVQPEEWVIAVLHSNLSREMKLTAVALAWAYQWHGRLLTTEFAFHYWLATGNGNKPSRDQGANEINNLCRRGWLKAVKLDDADPSRGYVIYLMIPEAR